jgi:CubicO group peptidase (beta-lactamase class C family)
MKSVSGAIPLLVVLMLLLTATVVCGQQTRPSTNPAKTADGWESVSPADENLDRTRIDAMLERIRGGVYRDVRSVIIARHGRLVVEEYFPRTEGDRREQAIRRASPVEMTSATKSVTSILIGIAIDKGLIRGEDERLATFFPEYAEVFAADPNKAKLTLKDLLTMTAGLAWDEWTLPYTDARNNHVAMLRSDDPIRYVLERPVVATPGETLAYNSGLSIVLGQVIFKASGLRADKFAERYLFEPLGITDFYWSKWPGEIVQTGGGLFLRPRDMAKLGQLFLNNGRWHGKPIVSEAWVKESTAAHVDATKIIPAARANGYAYQWWLGSFKVDGRDVPSYSARGRGGQFIFVFPEQQMVVVFTSPADNPLTFQPLDIITRDILPAAGD